jgi:hypothetical protein
MRTRFITGGRGTGKTTELIIEAVENPGRSVIVVSCQLHANYIESMLNKMYGNSNIVPVVTIRDILIYSRKDVGGSFTYPPKLYIDDLMGCLYSTIRPPFNCNIAAAVIDDDEEYGRTIEQYCMDDVKATYDIYTTQIKAKPHIDHVIFNGPATIVFWKDGTKTVVKHDGKGRKDKRTAIMYAFIRKIYGEGKAYHNILSEIEEALK